MSRYWGDEDCGSLHQVTRYLRDNYLYNGEKMPEEVAFRLVTEHGDLLRKGMSIRSHVSYLGDEIVNNAVQGTIDSFEWIEEEDEDEEVE